MWFLDQATRQLDQGLEAQTKGDLSSARFHYLKAAEFLFKAAEQSEGKLREKRIDLAQELLQRGDALEKLIQAGAGRKKGMEPAGAADDKGATWLVADRPHVTFADVAGLEDVKEQIRLKLIYPYTHPELAQQYGIKKGGGILLYGPPGTGKTLIAQAVAGEIEAAFFTAKASDLMSKWFGEAEQNIEALFKAAKAYDRSVVFLDEVDAIAPRRATSGSSVMPRVVSQILTELQGFHGHAGGLLVIGATNEPWSLDPAILRPGRFDDKIYVPLPDLAARQKVLSLGLKGKPLAPDLDMDKLAESLAGYSGADITGICDKASQEPFKEAIHTGVRRDIEMRDFLTILQLVKPSVSPKVVEKFEKFTFA